MPQCEEIETGLNKTQKQEGIYAGERCNFIKAWYIRTIMAQTPENLCETEVIRASEG